MVPLADGSERRYTLRPELAQQMEEARAAVESDGGDSVRRRADLRWGDDGYVFSETIVYLIRCCLIRGDHGRADRFAEALLSRVGPRVGARLRRVAPGLVGRLADDVVQEVVVALWPEIANPAAEFLETNFEHVLSLRTIDAVRRLTVERATTVEPDGDDPAWEPPVEDLGLQAIDDLDALARLIARAPSSRAQMVCWYLALGLPVEDKAHPERSISGLLGVTSRTVRNDLQAIRAAFEGAKEVLP